eukprot:scaffold41818_cov32-Tisochrysis_lutea.AAC.1
MTNSSLREWRISEALKTDRNKSAEEIIAAKRHLGGWGDLADALTFLLKFGVWPRCVGMSIHHTPWTIVVMDGDSDPVDYSRHRHAVLPRKPTNNKTPFLLCGWLRSACQTLPDPRCRWGKGGRGGRMPE